MAEQFPQGALGFIWAWESSGKSWGLQAIDPLINHCDG
jgi:hypothetical protein